MKWEKGKDSKNLIIGVVASLAAVILWDIVKKENKIFNYDVTNYNYTFKDPTKK